MYIFQNFYVQIYLCVRGLNLMVFRLFLDEFLLLTLVIAYLKFYVSSSFSSAKTLTTFLGTIKGICICFIYCARKYVYVRKVFMSFRKKFSLVKQVLKFSIENLRNLFSIENLPNLFWILYFLEFYVWDSCYHEFCCSLKNIFCIFFMFLSFVTLIFFSKRFFGIFCLNVCS